MKLRSLFLLPVLTVIAFPALAKEFRTNPVAVLELFTSQGCSSCPPADKLLFELGDRKDVIALAYHVDYWDYRGWRDTYGSAVFSDYQRSYAAARGEPRVYTPQLMINGTTDIVGSRGEEINAALSASSLPVSLAIKEDDGVLAISAKGNTAYPSAQLCLITFKSAESVAIKHGENRDRVLDYSHIATSRQVIGMWDQEQGVSLTLPVASLLGTKSDGAAIVIQEIVDGRPGRILGATSFLR